MKNIKKQNKGFFIIEALVAVLLFVFGILGILKLQVVQMQATSDAQYRTQAAYMAENIIGKMVIEQTNIASFVDGSNVSYVSWVEDLEKILPGVADNPPIITSSTSPSGGITVSVEIKWKAPQNSNLSKYILKTVIF